MPGLIGPILDDSLTLLEQIDETADRFEAAWKSGRRPNIADFLPFVPPEARGRLLGELIALDRAYRARRGLAQLSKDYWRQFRDLLGKTSVNASKRMGDDRASIVPLTQVEEHEILEELGREGMSLPIDDLDRSLRRTGVARFVEHFQSLFPDEHMKDLVVDAAGPGREVEILGRRVINFGSDSFLGLDRDPRVHGAIVRGLAKWGSHNGSSRMFTSVRANVEAEEKIAAWLGMEAALIYPSVTLANAGAIPGLVTKSDIVVADEYAHNSIHEASKVAKANGSRTYCFRHGDPDHLAKILNSARPYKHALIAVDGVFSMSGQLPPLNDLHRVALQNDAVLYVDDAHGTGVLGSNGRGSVYDNLGTYENVFVIGSLSKAFSCLGGFVGCPKQFQQLLKIRSNSYIFGGPVAPCYLEAVCTVIDILTSPDYAILKSRLQTNLDLLIEGIGQLGLVVLGGLTPIVSILVGDEETTLKAGLFLFERGFYAQSVTFPAVPYHAGVIRVQVNANHEPAQIADLVGAFRELRDRVPMPDQPRA
jgi:7-keto-8-aminopelargonate synthetase-like enzyme